MWLAAQNTPPTPVCGVGGVIVIRTCAAQRGGVSSVIVMKVVQLVVQQAKSIEMHVDRNYLKEILILDHWSLESPLPYLKGGCVDDRKLD